MSDKEIILKKLESQAHEGLIMDITALIREGRKYVATEFNSAIVLLYWSIGKRINEEILGEERADYGDEVINTLAQQLKLSFGKGYSRSALFRMLRFSRLYPNREIVATVSRQLSWSHVILVCQIDAPLKRDFYMQMTCIENWSVRTLREKMKTLLFERTAISKKPDELIEHELKKLKLSNQVTPDLIFKDPVILDFMGLDGKYTESDLENCILDNITDFIQELGNDFCFVARQKRMSIKKKDRYLDLLFFHRGMRRLIAIELKLGHFEPEHKGQMEWYLRWLDKNERNECEEKPLGIILCSDKDQEDVEYLELNEAGIHVSQYLTDLPPKSILEEKLHNAIAIARKNHETKRLERLPE
jgi:predicted nuclease of restriction endonuclease-like (RecB) superfamily